MFQSAAAILLGALALALDIEEEAGILVLNEANFDEAIKTHENILVEFYSPMCGRCIKFAPEYVKAASIVASQKLPYKLAKVDASLETNLAKKHVMNGYPTLMFFRNMEPIKYEGGDTDEEIVSWLRKTELTAEETKVEKIGLISILKTEESLEAFKLNHEKSLIAYCSDQKSPMIDLLKKASNIDGYGFGWVQDIRLMNNVSTEYHEIYDGQMRLYKKRRLGRFDLPHVMYEGDSDLDELQTFLNRYSFPSILELTPDTAEYVFNSEVKTHVLLFVSSLNGDFVTSAEQLMDVAQQIRERNGNVLDKSVLFVTIDVDEEDYNKLLTILGVRKGFQNIPTIRIVKLGENGEPTKKYKPAENLGFYLNEEKVKKFVEDCLEGKIESYRLSQTPPKDWNANPVKILTAENFDDVVFNEEKHVLVQFYSPWCGYCHRFEPIYEEVAKIFAGRFDGGRDYVIAKIDATANELEHTSISHYPTIKLYKKMTNEVIDFTGARSVKALVKFVESGGKFIEQAEEKPRSKDEL